MHISPASLITNRRSDFIGRDVCISRDRVEGILLGLAIGDALGFPVETQSSQEIAGRYGRLTDYVPAMPNRLSPGAPAGTCTDDTQLSMAVMEALAETGAPNLDVIARWHIKAYEDTTLGWGSSTREAVERLRAGDSYLESGKSANPKRGTGNGVVMKLAPVILATVLAGMAEDESLALVARFAGMTHHTHVAISSALAHSAAILECLSSRPAEFSESRFIESVLRLSRRAEDSFPLDQSALKLRERLERLSEYKTLDAAQIEKDFGGGSSDVFDSLPFTYMYFLRGHANFECVIELVNAGGDTDSNAALAGALLGALHGRAIFPQHLVDGLRDKDRVLELAGRFCSKFRIA